jgi:hypothetical protein
MHLKVTSTDGQAQEPEKRETGAQPRLCAQVQKAQDA